MISFQQAQQIVTENAFSTGTERTAFYDAAGRVIAEAIRSDMNMPPFDKSAVDGFACRKEDLGGEMLIIETIAAGQMPQQKITGGTASRIMTGAMVPEGSDYVFMVEDAAVEGEKVRFMGSAGNSNICGKGEDILTGDLLISAGIRLGPQHIACLAAVGAVNPLVYKKPRVGVISTGDELVEPEEIPSGPKIRNSNAYQLMAQIIKSGGIAEYFGIAKDSEEDLERMICRGIENNDVVLLTGGVSMGDFDFVPEILDKLGFSILIKSIAIQPGKPTVFARKENKFIFGLPGNPVSSFVLFEMLVKPFLNLMSGDFTPQKSSRMAAGVRITRKRAERLGIIPVRIMEGKIYPVEYHGSAHINAYSVADAMAIIEAGKKEVAEGEFIDVRQI